MDRAVLHVTLVGIPKRVDEYLAQIMTVDGHFALERGGIDDRLPRDGGEAVFCDQLVQQLLGHRPFNEFPGRILIL